MFCSILHPQTNWSHGRFFLVNVHSSLVRGRGVLVWELMVHSEPQAWTQWHCSEFSHKAAFGVSLCQSQLSCVFWSKVAGEMNCQISFQIRRSTHARASLHGRIILYKKSTFWCANSASIIALDSLDWTSCFETLKFSNQTLWPRAHNGLKVNTIYVYLRRLPSGYLLDGWWLHAGQISDVCIPGISFESVRAPDVLLGQMALMWQSSCFSNAA